MKHVSNLISINSLREQREQENVEIQPSPETAEVINWLFKELRSSFTAFKQAWPTSEEYNQAKKTWLKAFVLAGINRMEQLQHGLNHCYLMENPFVPSPGQFISWCKPTPESIGFPTTEEAYLASIRINVQFSDYRHQDERVDTVIRHAIHQIGSMSYREMKIENAKKTFKTYYDIALRQFMEGELKVIPKALPEKAEAHPQDRERSNAARERCMEMLRSKGIAINPRVQEDPV